MSIDRNVNKVMVICATIMMSAIATLVVAACASAIVWLVSGGSL